MPFSRLMHGPPKIAADPGGWTSICITLLLRPPMGLSSIQAPYPFISSLPCTARILSFSILHLHTLPSFHCVRLPLQASLPAHLDGLRCVGILICAHPQARAEIPPALRPNGVTDLNGFAAHFAIFQVSFSYHG